MFANSDDYDFAPSESSSLSALFSDSSTTIDNAEPNHSLMYTAPKDPSAKKHRLLKSAAEEQNKKPAPSERSAVICAKVVTLYKLEQNKYNSLGKHGLALIGRPSTHQYEIIVYKEKNNILTRANVNETFSFVNQNDSYSSFYDGDSRNWLVLFESEQDRAAFGEQIAAHGAKILQNKTTEHATVKKDDILQRMAKMGQAILPQSDKTETARTAEYCDSGSCDASKTNQLDTPKTGLFQFQAPQDALLSAFLMDNRAQNQDIRLSLAEIKMKLDCALNRNESPLASGRLGSKIKALELRNENLTQEVARLASRERELTELRAELERAESLGAERDSEARLEREVTGLRAELERVKSLSAEREASLRDSETRHEREVSGLRAELERARSLIAEREASLRDSETRHEREVSGLRAELERVKLLHAEREEVVEGLKSEVARFVGDEEGVGVLEMRAQRERDFREMLKGNMNALFECLVDDSDGVGGGFDAVLGKSIKRTTFKILKDFDAVIGE